MNVEDQLLLTDEQRTAIEQLETISNDIRSGLMTEFLGVGYNEATRQYKIFGGRTLDRHTSAGILLELAMERLRD